MLKEKHVIIDGKRVHYFHGGKGKTILFLHGWLLPSSAAYLDGLGKLAREYEVFAPSLITDNVRSLEGYERFINRFIKKMRLKDVTVIGHSFGAALAAELAAKHPKLVKRLVLIDALGIPVKKPFFWWVAAIGKSFKSLKSANLKAFLSWVALSFGFTLRMKKKHIMLISFKLMNSDYRHYFKKIKCRTLLVWGKDDEMFPVEHAYAIKKLVPGSSVKIVPGMHSWPIFYPESFYRNVSVFLKKSL